MEHAACLALGNLATDNKENSWEIVGAGAIPLLLEGMDMAEIRKKKVKKKVVEAGTIRYFSRAWAWKKVSTRQSPSVFFCIYKYRLYKMQSKNSPYTCKTKCTLQ